GVAWGNFANFLTYSAAVNSFAPSMVPIVFENGISTQALNRLGTKCLPRGKRRQGVALMAVMVASIAAPDCMAQPLVGSLAAPPQVIAGVGVMLLVVVTQTNSQSSLEIRRAKAAA